MLCRSLASTAMIAALILGAPARAQDAPSPDTVVASVGETEITLAHMLAVRGSLPEQYDRVPPDVLFDGVLNQLVQQTLLMQAQEGPLSRTARVQLDNDRRAVMAAEVAKGLFETRITDEAVRALYDSRYAEAEGPEYRAAHILVETEEEAQALIEEIEGGANFAALAQQHSIGPSGPSGGDLGWFGQGVMVPAFFDAVAALGEGGISAPLETEFGWHVIELREVRIKERPKLEDVRGDLAAELRQKAFDDYVAQLERESDVSRAGAEGIAPALINRLDLLED